jgi:hypothetical protein
LSGVRRQVDQIAQHDDDGSAPRDAQQRLQGPLHHPAVDAGVAAWSHRFERCNDSLELFAAPRARNGRIAVAATDESQAHRVTARERYACKRRCRDCRECKLRPPPLRAAESHRCRRVDDKTQRTVRLRLELPHDKPVMTEQRSPVEPAKVVTRHVFAVSAELDARATPRASVDSGIDTLGNLGCAEAQGGELPPVDGLPDRMKRAQGMETSGGRGPPSCDLLGSRMSRARITSLSSTPVPATTWRRRSSPPLVSPSARWSIAA